jgi:hypothetical protein
MVYFQTNISNLGTFWKALETKMLVYFMPVWNMLRPFGIFHGNFMVIWNIFHRFGILRQEKSGNPVHQCIHSVQIEASVMSNFNYDERWSRQQRHGELIKNKTRPG